MTDEHLGVTVLGVGTVRVPTTEAAVRLRVESRQPQPGAALREAGQVVATAFEVLRNAGVADRQVRTEAVSVTPNRVWLNDREEVQGYDASQGVHVRVVDLGILDTLLGKLVDACGTALRIEDVSLSGEPDAEARSRARAEAVRDAHEKASDYARLVDRTLGRAVSVVESSGRPSPPVPRGRKLAMAAASMPIAEGEQSSAVSVEIHWTFE